MCGTITSRTIMTAPKLSRCHLYLPSSSVNVRHFGIDSMFIVRQFTKCLLLYLVSAPKQKKTKRPRTRAMRGAAVSVGWGARNAQNGVQWPLADLDGVGHSATRAPDISRVTPSSEPADPIWCDMSGNGSGTIRAPYTSGKWKWPRTACSLGQSQCSTVRFPTDIFTSYV